MPRTFADLTAIEGMLGMKADDFGEEILELVNSFCESRNIRKKLPKGETFDLTMQMLNDGKSPEEIATERKLALTTIQGHISRLIKQGKIDYHNYINDSDLKTISSYLAENPEKGISDIYEHFEGKYDYFHIRIAMAVMEKEE